MSPLIEKLFFYNSLEKNIFTGKETKKIFFLHTPLQ